MVTIDGNDFDLGGALMEIRYYQRSSNLLLPRSSFAKLVRELLLQRGSKVTHFQSNALMGLQEAAEAYLAGYFESNTSHNTYSKLFYMMLTESRYQFGCHPRQTSNHSNEGHAACPAHSQLGPGRADAGLG